MVFFPFFLMFLCFVVGMHDIVHKNLYPFYIENNLFLDIYQIFTKIKMRLQKSTDLH